MGLDLDEDFAETDEIRTVLGRQLDAFVVDVERCLTAVRDALAVEFDGQGMPVDGLQEPGP
jgi:hypothetical protein